jgi:hypothetical protein
MLLFDKITLHNNSCNLLPRGLAEGSVRSEPNRFQFGYSNYTSVSVRAVPMLSFDFVSLVPYRERKKTMISRHQQGTMKDGTLFSIRDLINNPHVKFFPV